MYLIIAFAVIAAVFAGIWLFAKDEIDDTKGEFLGLGPDGYLDSTDADPNHS